MLPYIGVRIEAGKSMEHTISSGRHAWVQVVKGNLVLNEQPLMDGDGASVSDERLILLSAKQDTELLLFDLA